MSTQSLNNILDEGELDKQYAEYKRQFESWREQNKNHPDKSAFDRYEQQWKSWEAQVLQRRQAIRQMKNGVSHQKLPTVNLTTQQQQAMVTPSMADSSSDGGFDADQMMKLMQEMMGGAAQQPAPAATTTTSTSNANSQNEMMKLMQQMIGMQPAATSITAPPKTAPASTPDMSWMSNMMNPMSMNPMSMMMSSMMMPGMSEMMQMMMTMWSSMMGAAPTSQVPASSMFGMTAPNALALPPVVATLAQSTTASAAPAPISLQPGATLIEARHGYTCGTIPPPNEPPKSLFDINLDDEFDFDVSSKSKRVKQKTMEQLGQQPYKRRQDFENDERAPAVSDLQQWSKRSRIIDDGYDVFDELDGDVVDQEPPRAIARGARGREGGGVVSNMLPRGLLSQHAIDDKQIPTYGAVSKNMKTSFPEEFVDEQRSQENELYVRGGGRRKQKMQEREKSLFMDDYNDDRGRPQDEIVDSFAGQAPSSWVRGPMPTRPPAAVVAMEEARRRILDPSAMANYKQKMRTTGPIHRGGELPPVGFAGGRPDGMPFNPVALGIPCPVCYEVGHVPKDCPTLGDDGDGPCHHCKDRGHFARDCAERFRCDKCRLMGHHFTECPNSSVKTWMRPHTVCHSCGQRGHMVIECPFLKTNVACEHCMGLGHRPAKCIFKNKPIVGGNKHLSEQEDSGQGAEEKKQPDVAVTKAAPPQAAPFFNMLKKAVQSSALQIEKVVVESHVSPPKPTGGGGNKILEEFQRKKKLALEKQQREKEELDKKHEEEAKQSEIDDEAVQQLIDLAKATAASN